MSCRTLIALLFYVNVLQDFPVGPQNWFWKMPLLQWVLRQHLGNTKLRCLNGPADRHLRTYPAAGALVSTYHRAPDDSPAMDRCPLYYD
jgi:hypothetical protein